MSADKSQNDSARQNDNGEQSSSAGQGGDAEQSSATAQAGQAQLKAKSPPPRSGGSAVRWLIALGLGVLLGRTACAPEATVAEHTGAAHEAEQVAAIWTCSMDPQVRNDGPGDCPICGMDLIPLMEDDREGLDPAALVMSSNAMALANIATVAVERRPVSHQVRMVGKVAFDETRLSYITAWVPSRLDRLFVDYTGVSVRKGDHMAEVYSPQLIATQQELLAAVEAERRLNANGNGTDNGGQGVLGNGIDAIVARQAGSVRSARSRLRLWGLLPEQIDEIVAGGVVREHVTIYSPSSGVVIHKNAFQGDQVGTGTRIYTIADLSALWVQLDAYETDLAWLHYGQRVTFTSAAWPGETMEGRISFIDPVLDPRTRTVKVRLNIDNSDGKLKPDMFVHAVIEAPMTAGGQLVDAELAGLYMCPMHPEIVEETGLACEVCGMDLVTTEELGFRRAEVAELPLVVPVTAPLLTGKRAVVYVRDLSREEPTFVGRQIVLGPRAGDFYVVKSGLFEGEQVVVSGAFKIDSELQIHARPSMMNPDGGGSPPVHQHGGMGDDTGATTGHGPGATTGDDTGAMSGHDMSATGAVTEPLSLPAEFRGQLQPLLATYLVLQQALVASDAAAAERAGRDLAVALKIVPVSALDDTQRSAWMTAHEQLQAAVDRLTSSADIEGQRVAFGALSDSLIGVFDALPAGASDDSWGVFRCPMALDDGGLWLATGDEVLNPYYGDAMLHCGSRLGDLSGER